MAYVISLCRAAAYCRISAYMCQLSTWGKNQRCVDGEVPPKVVLELHHPQGLSRAAVCKKEVLVGQKMVLEAVLCGCGSLVLPPGHPVTCPS